MTQVILNNAKLTLLDGSEIYGPVTSQDELEFLFRNTYSDLDVYFRLKKDQNKNWYFAGGPDVEIPNDYIQQIGNQIDNR